MSTFDLESFQNPPMSARPMVRWWWTGVDVEEEELCREVRELDEAGFLGAEIQVFMTGSPGNLAKTDPERYRRAHRFMQPYYYQMVQAVLDEAAARDMVFDLTICSAWPAGGTHVGKEDSLKTLLMGARTIRGGRRYVGRVPGLKKPFFCTVSDVLSFLGILKLVTYCPADMRLLRVVAARPVGKPGKVKSFRPWTAYLDIESAVDLTGQVNGKRILEWDVPEGTWQIFAFYAGPSGTHPLMDARADPGGVSLVLDHLAREPVEKHLEHHLGRAKAYFGHHFGKALRAFFTDSLELAPEWMWAGDFLREFQKRRGYDLTPYLPVNYVPGRDNKYLSVMMQARPCFDFAGNLGERIRHDFEQTVSDLFAGEFAQAMTDWAEANGLQSRIQAYGIRADTLAVYGTAHIPETEQLFAGGARDFLRLAGSAGVIYDKPLVTAESLVWNQRDYLTTPLKWKVAADRLFASGINQMIYHGFPYQNPAFPYPGYDAFSSPYMPKAGCFASNFSRMNPFWEFFPQMNAYVSRCQYVLRQGRTVCNVGLFYSLFNYPDAVLAREELIGGHLDEFDAPLARRAVDAHLKEKPDHEERWVQGQIALADYLLAHGYSYVHVNPARLLDARAEGAKLVVGAARLDALVLFEVERITVEVARKLQEIAAAGVPVVFVGSMPNKQPGFYNFLEHDALVSAAMSELHEQHGNLVREASGLAAYLSGSLGLSPDLGFEKPLPTIHHLHKHAEGVDLYFLRHATREPVTVSVLFRHPGCTPLMLDPWTGKAAPAAQYEERADGVRIDLHFAPYGSCLVAFGPSKEARHVVRGDLPSVREEDALAAYTGRKGEYTFWLDDGNRVARHVERDAPLPVDLVSWRLETELRHPDGSLEPVHLDLARLDDWRNIPALRYCSSRGVYTTRVHLEADDLQGGVRLTLDLGRVHDAAVVAVNGETLPPFLVCPFAADVTPYLKVGENEIRVAVTPTLRNQLVGYARRGKDWKQFKGRELAPSGLIGPVRLVAEYRIEI